MVGFRIPGQWLVLMIVLTVNFVVTTASGHGRFPQAGMVVVDPSDPERLLALTTYGVLSTFDHGGRWDWICSESVGYDADLEDPVGVVMADGSIAVGVFDGLSVSASDACDWSYQGGELQNRNFVDVVREADPSAAVALSSNGVGVSEFAVNLWESSDNAQTWAKLPTSGLPVDFLAVTLGLPLSDSKRLYLSGRDGTGDMDVEGVLYRSDDRGQNWSRFPVPFSVPGTNDQLLPYIAGVDPIDPDSLYVAVIGSKPDGTTYFGLQHSGDAGETWVTVLERNESMAGFALSPDGTRVAVGGDDSGLLIAKAGEWEFEKVNSLRVRCLTWTDRGIYACADQFVDGFSLGLSEDEGGTFAPLMELSSACGPPTECGADSGTAQICLKRWPAERAELGAEDCDSTPVTPGEPPGDAVSGCRWAPARRSLGGLPARDPGAPLGIFVTIGLLGLFRYRSRRGSRRRGPVRA